MSLTSAERKRQLLEMRLGGSLEQFQDESNNIANDFSRASNSNSRLSAQSADNINERSLSLKEISTLKNSASPKRPIDMGNLGDNESSPKLQRIDHIENSLNGNVDNESSPKFQRIEHNENSLNANDAIGNIQKKKRSDGGIKSYFAVDLTSTDSQSQSNGGHVRRHSGVGSSTSEKEPLKCPKKVPKVASSASSSAGDVATTVRATSLNSPQAVSTKVPEAPVASSSEKPMMMATKSKDKTSGPGTAPVSVSSSSLSSSIPPLLPVDMKRQLEQLQTAKEEADRKIARLESELRGVSAEREEWRERNNRLVKSLQEIHRANALAEGRRKRDRLATDCVRLGKIVAVRQGPTSMGDIWEEGYASKELASRRKDLARRKEELEARRKQLQTQKKKAGAGRKSGAVVGESSGTAPAVVVEDGEGWDAAMDLDLVSEETAIKGHLEHLKREESVFIEEEKLLNAQKETHKKELKRIQSEDRSRFTKDLPCLKDRYQLVSLLGRGGFSEVWKAVDLQDIREVAVKVHQLANNWSEERKQSFVKHVTREYHIHKDMKHPRVVQLFDVFEIDVDSFATVLELCRGIDLDETLKTNVSLPEKEARIILLQILSGLRYLNTGSGDSNEAGENNINITATGAGARRKCIIHYDLKPANILFDEFGDAKITDFGLSKILEEDGGGTSMELTSAGAGTYWYLPPEVFEDNPKISSTANKIDVWSVGVIFFQMLFGKRPLGDGMSQERVLHDRVILNAGPVSFPVSPKVSEEAKEFIRECLTRDQRDRPDVLRLCSHSYLRQGSRK